MPRQPDASVSAVTLLYRRQRWMGHMRVIRSVARTLTVLALGGLVGTTFLGGHGVESWPTATRLTLAVGVLAWVVQIGHEHRIASHQLDARMLLSRVRALEVELAGAEGQPGRSGPRGRYAP